MIARSIIGLAFIVLCALIGLLIAYFPMNVMLKLPQYVLIIPLVYWLILSFLAAWLLGLVFKTLLALWRSPQILSRSSEARKKRKSDKMLRLGLHEFIAGDYAKAEKHLVKGAHLCEALGESSIIFYENAAIAADRQNAPERRDAYLLKARQEAGAHDAAAIRLTEAEVLIANGEHARAEKLLENVADRRNPKLLALLDQAYTAQEKWTKAWALLPALRATMNSEDYDARRKTYARAMLNDTAALESYAELSNAWRNIPAEIRREPDMVLIYAGSLAENGHSEESDKVLAEHIKSTQNLAFIQAYSQLRSGNFKARLANMQQWEARHPNDALFLLAKAQIAYFAKEYDIANAAVEASLKRQPSSEGFALWAQILEARDEPQAALAAYRQSVSEKFAGKGLHGDFLPAGQQPPAVSHT
ncbi:MAG: heme biosynthesis HemY N-terminal domain-containing protein [Cardiobacteriaceae bacterium]|nr:heme biosynthesis HemY N-terminal domain-containing protein [Cardiobacteriaceae bacterium]